MDDMTEFDVISSTIEIMIDKLHELVDEDPTNPEALVIGNKLSNYYELS
jgi:hypothetical protein